MKQELPMINRKVFVTISAAVLISGIGLTASAIDHPNRPTSSTLGAAQNADIALNERIENLLRTDIGLTGSRFRIQTQSGVVTLGGGVPDEHSLQRALELAASVKGVREVRNELEIEFPK
jgi:osmotically-inducible protein OsmY